MYIKHEDRHELRHVHLPMREHLLIRVHGHVLDNDT